MSKQITCKCGAKPDIQELGLVLYRCDKCHHKWIRPTLFRFTKCHHKKPLPESLRVRDEVLKLLRMGKQSTHDLAEKTGVNRNSLYTHLLFMLRDGRVEKEKANYSRGCTAQWFLTR